MDRSNLFVGIGLVFVVVGLFVVPALDISQPRYGFGAYEVDEERIEGSDWEVEAFEDLPEEDQERVLTIFEDGYYDSYGDDDVFEFDAVVYEGAFYRIELAEIAEPAPFPVALTVPLVALGVLSIGYGGYGFYNRRS